MIRRADKVLRVIAKAIHEGLIALILQYVGTKEMVNNMNDLVLPEWGISRGREGGNQGLDMIWCWYIQDHNNLIQLFSTVTGR
jgi:hypothetical protein